MNLEVFKKKEKTPNYSPAINYYKPAIFDVRSAIESFVPDLKCFKISLLINVKNIKILQQVETYPQARFSRIIQVKMGIECDYRC